MIISDIALDRKLATLIKEYTDDQYCLLELLRFLGRHPNTRFSRLVIIHALNSRKLYTERAIRYLTAKGVVRTHIENSVPFYSLTENEPLRSLALDLARLDWCRWQLVLGQICPTLSE
jgi:hypothetical protein